MSDRPIRIQRKRTKGWRMPPNTVYVGRPSKWGNQYVVWDTYTDALGTHKMTPQKAVELFREKVQGSVIAQAMIFTILGGKNLACWCPLDQPCHADVLLELANPRKATSEQSAGAAT